MYRRRDHLYFPRAGVLIRHRNCRTIRHKESHAHLDFDGDPASLGLRVLKCLGNIVDGAEWNPGYKVTRLQGYKGSAVTAGVPFAFKLYHPHVARLLPQPALDQATQLRAIRDAIARRRKPGVCGHRWQPKDLRRQYSELRSGQRCAGTGEGAAGYHTCRSFAAPIMRNPSLHGNTWYGTMDGWAVPYREASLPATR